MEAQTIVNLMSAMAIDPPSRVEDTLKALRAQMQSRDPALRFNEGQLVHLRRCFALHENARKLIDAWAVADGVVLPPPQMKRAQKRRPSSSLAASVTSDAAAASVVDVDASSVSSAALESRLSSLLERARAPNSLTIEVSVARFPAAAWTRTALLHYLHLYSATRGAVHALRAFALLQEQQSLVADVECVVALLCCFGADWSDAHLARMDQLRADLRARGLALTVADVLRLHTHLREQPSARVRLRRWAMEDGVITWLPATVKRELEDAGKLR